MRTKQIVIPLVLLVAAGLLAAWQLLAPAPAKAPPSGNLPLGNAAAINHSEPLKPDSEPLDEPKLPAPPSAPEVVNDPAKGTIWLRVIDASTNQPLANTECEMWRLRFLPRHEGPAFEGMSAGAPDAGVSKPRRHPPLDRRSTQADGLLELSAAEARATGDTELAKDVVFSGQQVDCLWPLPAGYEPAEDPAAAVARLSQLSHTPSTRPVDCFVRRAPGLTVTVKDAAGVPAPQTQVYAIPEHAPKSLERWAAFRSVIYAAAHGERIWLPELYAEDGKSPEQMLKSLLDADVRGTALSGPWCNQVVIDFDYLAHLAFKEHLACQDEQYFAITDAAGQARWATLFTGRWRVMVWNARYGLVETVVSLRDGVRDVDVVMPTSTLCGLRVVTVPVGDAELEGLELTVVNVGPLGPIESHAHLSAGHCFEADDLDCREFEIGGLHAGFWQVQIWDGIALHSQVVQLLPGEFKTVEMYVGENAVGTWKPLLRFGSRVVPGGEIYLQGSGYAEITSLTLDWNDELGVLETRALPSGQYTAWVPGLAPVKFEIRPQQATTTVFEIPAASVSFSIDGELAAVLSPDGEPLRLDLFGTGPFESGDFFRAMGAVLLSQDEGYEFLSPGKSSNWWVPPCDYRWELHGSSQELRGTLRIAPGNSAVHFSFKNLPGLAGLEVIVADAEATNRPTLWLDDTQNEPLPTMPDVYGDRPRYMTPRSQPIQESFELALDDGKRWLLLAPPGNYLLHVEGNETRGRYAVNLPGAMTIRLSQLAVDSDVGGIQLVTDEEEIASYTVTAIGRDYTRAMADGEFNVLELGPVTLQVTRVRYDENGDAQAVQVHSLSLVITNTEHELNLSRLPYVAAPTLTLTCQGPGDPGNTIDPWWMPANVNGPGIASISLRHENRWVPVLLPGPDTLCPGGRVEFSYSARPMPPGTYRVVPWQGAADKYCREFTLEPGKHTTIVIKTE